MPGGPDLLAFAFRAAALAVAVGAPLHALRVRGRRYAVFAVVILGFSLPGAVVMRERVAGIVGEPARATLDAALLFGVVAAGAHLAHLVRARLRGRLFRLCVSVPGQTFLAAGFLAGLWLLVLLPPRAVLLLAGADTALALLRWLDLLPLGVALLSVATSARRPLEWVRVPLGGAGPDEVTRVPVERRQGPQAPTAAALRVVQIADPHIGPWQPVARLRDTLERLLRFDPDLVLLTGDFLTMEAQGTPGALAEALSPLARVATRCVAIFGNHDHEAPEEVRGALEKNGIRLLVDDEAVVDTRLGPVQIVGADYVGRGRRRHLEALLARFPRRGGLPRLLLLHDPAGFRHVPDGEADLVLSGHTHGGQLGLLSLGLDWTVLSRSRWPDHGLFAKGSNRLYVHRGTGFYGFPLRVGVPGETSVLELVRS